METALLVLLFLHFIGLASLLGGFLVQMSTATRVVNNAMIHGALTQLITGIAMVGVLAAQHASDVARYAAVDDTKYGVKLLVVLVILGLVLAQRRKTSVPPGAFFAIGGLTVVNIAVAVFWR
ncbi:MAG: hypothetical protein ACYCXA_06125 [Actinomycetes bacterium]